MRARLIIGTASLVLIFYTEMSGNAADQRGSFPYSLNMYTEAGLLSVGGSLVGLSMCLAERKHSPTASEIEKLDRDDVNPVDRIATYYYSQSASHASNALEYAAASYPAILLIPQLYDGKWCNAFTILLMYGEAQLINWGLTDSVKNIVDRERPYLYNDDVSMDEKLSHRKENLRSFYSGHTSTSFCAAVFLSKVFGDIYPHSWIRYVVYAVSIGTAAATGYFRVRAGKHFPSDVAAGAVMGGAVGYFVPVLHYKKDLSVSVIPFAGDSSGVAISMNF